MGQSFMFSLEQDHEDRSLRKAIQHAKQDKNECRIFSDHFSSVLWPEDYTVSPVAH